jgi:hypothetical protein
MDSLKERLDREVDGLPISSEALAKTIARARRRSRNQRIAAGVVGIAVFVAAVWVVTSVGSLDRSETSVVPGGDVTGPAAETGPTVTGPVIGKTGDPSSVGFGGLPPEGATQSEPQHGELVMTDGGSPPWYSVNLYADGRLIWARDARPGNPAGVSVWIEQRLTPEGVELLRSGAVPLGGQFHNPAQGLPASAWEDPKLRPYVPSRYAICPWHFWGNASRAMSLLPARAQDLLRGTERNFTTGPPVDESFECFDVTIEDARALAGILRDAGFRGPETDGFIVQYVDDQDIEGVIDFDAIFPDGRTQVTWGF